MNEHSGASLRELLGLMFKAHPWHGVSIGEQAPWTINAYVELTPTDTVKFELDKVNGYLKIDRPQRYSNICPALYGFIPQTFCAEQVAARCDERTGRTGMQGDGDPLDICIFTEKDISHGDILVHAIPIGGLRAIDGNEADDKIIAVLEGDVAYGNWRDISQCPDAILDRLRHYFLTYKLQPNSTKPPMEIAEIYDLTEAHEVIARSRRDYDAHYGDHLRRLAASVERTLSSEQPKA